MSDTCNDSALALDHQSWQIMTIVSTLRARIQRHAFDWVLLAVLIVAVCVLESSNDGFKRQFSLTDTAIQFPHATKERVPTFALFLISLVAPSIIVVALPVFLDKPLQRIHYGLLGLGLTYCFTETVTNIIKLNAGRPRPDLLDRCRPSIGAQTLSSNTYHSTLVDASVCTTPLDSSLISDGFKSFPSGHSSSSFCGLVYLGFYVRHILWHYAQRLSSRRYAIRVANTSTSDVSEAGEPDTGLLNRNDEESDAENARSLVLLGVVVQLLLLLGATMVGVSRTMDYRHHSTDVLAGGIIGSLIAAFFFHVYHPLAIPRFEMLQ